MQLPTDITSRHAERGQAAAEFALVLPVMCLMLLGIIAYGQMIWTKMDLTSATRDGARRAAVARVDTAMNPNDNVRSVVRSSLDRTDPNKVTVTSTGSWTKDARITVTSSMPYHLNIMGITVWSGQLRAESLVRIG